MIRPPSSNRDDANATIGNIVDAAVAYVSNWGQHSTDLSRQALRIEIPVGGGLTTALTAVRHRLIEDGKNPILISGIGDLDGPAAACIDIADALDDADLSSAMRDMSIPSVDKVRALRASLRQHSNAVLLLDRPARWQSSDEGAAGELNDVLQHELLEHFDTPIVVGGDLRGVAVNTQKFGRISFPREWMEDGVRRAPHLKDSIASMLIQFDDMVTELPTRGAVARLAVLLHAFGTQSMKGYIRRSFGRGITVLQLHEMLDRQLRSDPDSPTLNALAIAWDQFALLRVPISVAEADHLLELTVGGLVDAEKRKSLIWGLTIDHDDDQIKMNDQVRFARVPRRNPVLHEHAAKIFQTRAAQSAAGILRPGLEAWYHLIHTDITPESEQVHAYFVEQLCLRGKAASQQGFWKFVDNGWRMPVDAVACFEAAIRHFTVAIEYEPANSYALHYRGYNRDGLGEVEAEIDYREALALQPQNEWWHSRLITHLLAKGAHTEAEAAWEYAVDTCSEHSSRFLAEHLHRWVLRVAIEVGDFTFAFRIRTHLADVDLGGVRADFDEMFRRIDRYDLGIRDLDVLPLSVDLEQLGRAPLVLSVTNLDRWRNARIDAVESDTVVLRVSQWWSPEGQPDTAQISTLTMPIQAFAEHLATGEPTETVLTPGHFIELGEYGDQSPVIEWVNLPPAPRLRLRLFPDPARFQQGRIDSE